MEILVITRLYSGFENSLNKLKWKPEGVPAIYKLIEKLDKYSHLNLFLMSKDSGKTYTSNWTRKRDETLKIVGLQNKVNVFAGISFFNSILPKKIAMIARDFRHLFKILFIIKKKRPDIIYCDSSNVVLAYFVNKFFPNIPIVLRVLGVCSFLRSLPTSKRIVHNIYKKAFKAKFSAVIGTQDGSGVEYWFEKILHKDIKRYTILNGVDQRVTENNIQNKYTKLRNSRIDETIILYVGRLEEYKGIKVFLNAVLKLLKENNKPCKILIAGNGSLFHEVENKIDQSTFKKNFILFKNIPHKDILQLHFLSDIYVSTNTDGNLSNANLEAISSNDCMIIPAPNKKEKIDIKTSSYLKDSVIYYENESVDDLTRKLQFLLLNPKYIKKMNKKIKKIKSSFLKTWEQRIQEEIEILKNSWTNN